MYREEEDGNGKPFVQFVAEKKLSVLKDSDRTRVCACVQVTLMLAVSYLCCCFSAVVSIDVAEIDSLVHNSS